MRRWIVLAGIGLLLAALPGCFGSGVSPASKPLSKAVLVQLAAKGLKPGDPIFVRIFKEESQLEVWMRPAKSPGRRYVMFKSYPICNWSGKLGPKLKEGDRQAPEGFYVIRPRQLNPNSKLHLAFNLGFPNPYDKARNRTGSYLMVHGDCSSAGCYAMTDSQIEELYALVREAYRGGQRFFQLHAFPFRMTAQNMQRYEGHKWFEFWRNLKEGYDVFEARRRPPPIGVLNKRYVFNIPGNASLSGAVPSLTPAARPVIIARDAGD